MKKNNIILRQISCVLTVLFLLQMTIIPLQSEKAYASNLPTADIFPKPQSVTTVTEAMTFSGTVDIVMHGEHVAATKTKILKLLDANNITYQDADVTSENAAIVVSSKCDDSNCDICSSVTDSANALSKEQGYVLCSSNDINNKGQVQIVGTDADGAFYGVMSLYQMFEQKNTSGSIAEVTISDYPDIKNRGYVEGFYGVPWSYSDRSRLFSDTAKYKLNTYIYAPKDDPYHKDLWKTLYPDDEANKVKELVEIAKENNMTFCWTIHPGSNYSYDIDANRNGMDDDLETLIEKLEQVYSFGVRRFGVMYDDIYVGYAWGERQANVINTAYNELKKKYDDILPMITVPTHYTHTTGETEIAYLTEMFNSLNSDVEVLFTGKSVASKVDKSDFDWPRNTTGVDRNVSAWWNYPVNDMFANETNLMLMGPLEVLNTDIYDEATDTTNLDGFYLNPMNEAEASKVAIYSGGDYAWNTAEFDYMQSWERAIYELLPEANESLQRFADNSSRRVDTAGDLITTESKYLDADISAFEAAIENGTSVKSNVATMKAHFEQMLSDITELRQISYTELLEEIEPFLGAYEKIAEAGKQVMDAYEHGFNGNIDECDALMEEMPDLINAIETTKIKGVNYLRVAGVGTYRIIPFIKLATENYKMYTPSGVLDYFKDKDIPSGTASVEGNLSCQSIDLITDKDITTAPVITGVATGDSLTYTLNSQTAVERILVVQDLNALSGATVSVNTGEDNWITLGKLESNSNEFKVWGKIEAVKFTFNNVANPTIYELYIEEMTGDAPIISTDELSALTDELSAKNIDLYSPAVASLKEEAMAKAEAVLAKDTVLFSELSEAVSIVKEALASFKEVNVDINAKLWRKNDTTGEWEYSYSIVGGVTSGATLDKIFDESDTTYFKPWGGQNKDDSITFEFDRRIDISSLRIYSNTSTDYYYGDVQISYTGDNWVTIGTITSGGEVIFTPDAELENVKYVRLLTTKTTGYYLTLNEVTFKSKTIAAARLSTVLEEAADINVSLYTSETADAFAEAFNAAKAEIKNESATYESLLSARDSLITAQNGLTKLSLVNVVTESYNPETYPKENLLDGDETTGFAVRGGSQEIGDTLEFEFPFKTNLSSITVISDVYKTSDKYYLRRADVLVSSDGKEWIAAGEVKNAGVCTASLDGAQNVKYLRLVVTESAPYQANIFEVDFGGGIFENQNMPYEDALTLKAQIDAKNLDAYTDDTVAALNNKITAFETICNNLESTSSAAVAALDEINTAFLALEKKPLDYTTLDAAILTAKATPITNRYTEASKAALSEAISVAEEAKLNTELEQTDLDAVEKALLDAVAGLENVILSAVSSEITAAADNDLTSLVDGDVETSFESAESVILGDAIDFAFEFPTDLSKITLSGDSVPNATVKTSVDGVSWSDAVALNSGIAEMNASAVNYARLSFTEVNPLKISEVTFEGGIFANTTMPFDKAITLKNEISTIKTNRYTKATVDAMEAAKAELFAMCNSSNKTEDQANSALSTLTNAKNKLVLVKYITPSTSIATVNGNNYLSYIVDGTLTKFYKTNESQKVGQTIDFEFAIKTDIESIHVYGKENGGDTLQAADIFVSYDGINYEETRVGTLVRSKDDLVTFEEPLRGVKKVQLKLTTATGMYMQINEVIFGGGVFDNDIIAFDEVVSLMNEIEEIDMSLYTDESKAALNAAIVALEEEASSETSTFETLSAAIAEVEAKKEALARLPREENIEALQAAIDASEPYTDMEKYTIASAEAFTAAKETALAVIDDYSTTQAQVDEAAENLTIATNALTLRKNIIKELTI